MGPRIVGLRPPRRSPPNGSQGLRIFLGTGPTRTLDGAQPGPGTWIMEPGPGTCIMAPGAGTWIMAPGAGTWIVDGPERPRAQVTGPNSPGSKLWARMAQGPISGSERPRAQCCFFLLVSEQVPQDPATKLDELLWYDKLCVICRRGLYLFT